MEFLNRGLDFSVRILFRTFAFSFVVCLLAPAVFPQSLPQRLPRSVSMASGFVGGSTCRKCHPSEYESYQKMSMASSLYKPMLANDPEFAVSTRSYFHARSGFHYEMVVRDGKFYQKRFLLDASGKPRQVHEEEITYVVGSGNHARSYLRHHSDGRITQFPVTWYPQENSWAMSPGYDSAGQPDFSRDVNHDCVFCHTSYPKLIPSLAYLERFFPYELPLGIDCERCHGPGEQHVKLVYANAPTERIQAAIFQPARASKQLQRELCYTCHFEAGARFARDRIYRREGDVFSYRPGQPLSQFIINLDYAPKDRPNDEFKIAHQGYRLEQSVCFQKSQGEITCSTCHDPHRPVEPENKVRWFRSRCLQCHREDSCGEKLVARQQRNEDCTACHMWKRRTADVVHTILTDHMIQRRKPNVDFLAPLAEEILTMDSGRDLTFLEPQTLSPPDRAYFLGMAYLQLPLEQLAISERQRAKGVELLQEFLAEVEGAEKKSDYSTYLSRGYATLTSSYRAQGIRDRALDACQRSLQYDSKFVVAYNYKCGLLNELGRPVEALECFQQSLALNPWDSLTYRHIGSLYARDGALDEATRWFRLSLSVDPDNASTNHYLGNALAEKGDLKAAIGFFETAIGLEPRDPEVYWDCALAFLNEGRRDLALQYIKNGLQYAPTDSRGRDLLSKISRRANADQGIPK